jgi:hypothetical protein
MLGDIPIEALVASWLDCWRKKLWESTREPPCRGLCVELKLKWPRFGGGLVGAMAAGLASSVSPPGGDLEAEFLLWRLQHRNSRYRIPASAAIAPTVIPTAAPIVTEEWEPPEAGVPLAEECDPAAAVELEISVRPSVAVASTKLDGALLCPGVGVVIRLEKMALGRSTSVNLSSGCWQQSPLRTDFAQQKSDVLTQVLTVSKWSGTSGMQIWEQA